MTEPVFRKRTRLTQEPAASGTALSNRLTIVERRPEELRPASRRARKAGKGQVERLRTNIDRFGCLLPILVTADCEIIDGHNVWAACKLLERSVPTVEVDHLSEAEVRALRLSLNKLGDLSTWDDDIVRDELAFLINEDPELSLFTGFTAAEIDARLAEPAIEEDEQVSTQHPALGQPGDAWIFEGGHVLLQGNARHATDVLLLMDGKKARALISDMPYGCKIKGHASRSHADFLDGSNMADDELLELAEAYLRNAKPVMLEGALSYTFMDGRGLHALMSASRRLDQQQVALCVWDKVNPGMGSLYRQQAEFIQVCKFDRVKHVNNVALGKNRRNRSNIFNYPGMASFGAARTQALAMHPTVKPVGLIADIILDCTERGDVVLDPFAGSGTILLAARRTKRRGYAIELDPVYVDVAVARMERATGQAAVHRATRQTYAETMRARQAADAARGEL